MKVSLGLSLLGCSCLAACGSPESRVLELKAKLTGSNVVIIAVNSFAAKHTTPYGYERETTPTLSNFAQESVRFTDVSAGSSSSFASVNSLLRGEAVEFCEAQRPGELAGSQAPHLAHAFKSADYRVLALSTDPTFRSELGSDQGFEAFSFVPKTEGGGVPEAAQVIFKQYVESTSPAPFFIYVQLGTARLPRAPQPEHAQALLGYKPDASAGQRSFFERMQSARSAPKRTLKAIDLYDAVLNDVDFALAQFSATLKRCQHWDDSLLIVTGTCGQAFGQRGHFGVGQDVYQEQIAVPLLMRLPNAHAAGLVVRDPVALYDLFPTLADLFDLDVSSSQSGSTLALLLTEDWHERAWPVSSRTVAANPQWSMRLGHFKLIESQDSTGTTTSKLMNLERDELETSDHGTQRPETKRELERELGRFRETAAHSRSQPNRVELSPAVIEELQALGYSAADLSLDGN